MELLALLPLLLLVAGFWSLWLFARHVGEGPHRRTGPDRDDWNVDRLPSRPYRELRHL
jgi:hypothetical protein